MPDPLRSSDTNPDNGVGADPASTVGPPRWVKVFGLIALGLVVLVVILMLMGGHGPGRHT